MFLKNNLLFSYNKTTQEMRGRSMRQIAASYLQFIKDEKGLSPNTLESYSRDIRDFCDFLETLQITNPNEISHTDLMRYMSNLERRGKSNGTISRIAASLRSFFGDMY